MGQEYQGFLTKKGYWGMKQQKPKDEPTADFKPFDKKQLKTHHANTTQDCEAKLKKNAL